MTEKRDISRRSALKGIAGTGALVSGLGLAGSASAVNVPDQDPNEQIADVSFDGCEAVEIVFRKDTHFPVEGLQFVFYSPDERSVMKMTPTIRYGKTEKSKGKHGSKRRRFRFSGGINPKHDRILAVSVGEETYENPCSCKKKGHHDGIALEGVCYKKKKNRAKFVVSNGHGKAVDVTWKEKEGKASDTLTVPKKGTAEFWVPLHDGKKTGVALYHDGEKVAVAKADTDDRCNGH